MARRAVAGLVQVNSRQSAQQQRHGQRRQHDGQPDEAQVQNQGAHAGAPAGERQRQGNAFRRHQGAQPFTAAQAGGERRAHADQRPWGARRKAKK